jgi:hypothetical protein
MPLTFGDTHPNAMPVLTADVLLVSSLEADVARLEAEKLRLQDEMSELHVEMRGLHDQKARLLAQVLSYNVQLHSDSMFAQLNDLKAAKERLEALVLEMRASREKELTRMRCL